ncbi:MAG: hypothetical protein RR322_05990 [Oscillospiraceae bacterium]
MKLISRVISLTALAAGAAYAINRLVNCTYEKISGKYVTPNHEDFIIGDDKEQNYSGEHIDEKK